MTESLEVSICILDQFQLSSDILFNQGVQAQEVDLPLDEVMCEFAMLTKPVLHQGVTFHLI